MSANERLSRSQAVELLSRGEIEVVGRMPDSSNATLYAKLTLEEMECAAIYKPARGERPLWDFPPGLHRREVAAWMLSEALGWELIPPTILRLEAPYGEGSFQLFIDADFSEHYFSLAGRQELAGHFVRLAAFDLIANNTDRKSGHVVIDADGHIWGIDNGLTFHTEPKLRTVIWEFGGTQLSEEELEAVRKVEAEAASLFQGLLDAAEIDAFRSRARFLARKRRLPALDPDRRPYPWPLV
ncbi:MAG: SCO1664 family protein [Actinomycetota bacterium]|nr:SCO1664 family protein [Actinomycetota bacterium]